MEIQIIAFKNNISEIVLNGLNIQKKYYIDSDEKFIRNFVDNFKFSDGKGLVIGLGEYSGRDKEKLRIETICTNKFRNGVIALDSEGFKISNNIKVGSNSKLAKGIGNSYCNLMSYLFSLKLLSKNIKNEVGFAFIHIPKSFKVEVAIEEIMGLLSNLMTGSKC